MSIIFSRLLVDFVRVSVLEVFRAVSCCGLCSPPAVCLPVYLSVCLLVRLAVPWCLYICFGLFVVLGPVSCLLLLLFDGGLDDSLLSA
jgi:hypothetical protein